MFITILWHLLSYIHGDALCLNLLGLYNMWDVYF